RCTRDLGRLAARRPRRRSRHRQPGLVADGGEARARPHGRRHAREPGWQRPRQSLVRRRRRLGPERPDAWPPRQAPPPPAGKRPRSAAAAGRLAACLVAERPLDRGHPRTLMRPEPRPATRLWETNSTGATLRMKRGGRTVKPCVVNQFVLAFSRRRRQEKGGE